MMINRSILSIIPIIFIMACSQAVEESNLIERDGLKFLMGKRTPYSVKMVSSYENGQKKEEGMYKDDSLYFVSCRDIPKGEEMFYWMDDPDLLWTKKKCEMWRGECGFTEMY